MDSLLLSVPFVQHLKNGKLRHVPEGIHGLLVSRTVTNFALCAQHDVVVKSTSFYTRNKASFKSFLDVFTQPSNI